MFVDEAVIKVRSGAGGRGCVSFRRERYVPRGGPDGADGGDGGDVVLRATHQLTTLVDVARRSLYSAKSGRSGQGSNCTGRRGESVKIDVPVGTIVREVVEGRDPRLGLLVSDLSQDGQEVIVARGGRGGRGNRAFMSSKTQAPRIAEDGGPADEKTLYLELKLLADVGLVGLPNAGKSTVLSRFSAASPKIADYPFTTLHPVLGIVEIGDWRRLVFADIPGLIEGAHEGHGLGIEFLRHIERTRVLVHLVAAETTKVDTLAASYRVIERELAGFNETLAKKPRLVALSKCDVLPADQVDALVAEFAKALGQPVIPFSAVTGHGVPELLRSVEALCADP